jgi:putative PIN family toxin of toxin-antitoxin system
MSAKRRYVFDAGAIVSALLFEHSTPGRAFYGALETGELLLSLAVIDELHDVLGRRKFDRYLSREERQQFLQLLLQDATLVDVTRQVHACRDPDDDKYLALAVSGGASCIVSGDQDLLTLNPFEGIAILTPAQFLAELPKGPGNGSV